MAFDTDRTCGEFFWTVFSDEGRCDLGAGHVGPHIDQLDGWREADPLD